MSAGSITARLDRLPPSPSVWRLVVLLGMGSFFAVYDLGQTGNLIPGLVRAGIFQEKNGFFGLPDQATFASATFAGLFLGALVGALADRMGRRLVFTTALLWYTAATMVMAFQSTAFGVDLWRLIAGIGLGVELVTIDTYAAELFPRAIRGKAFAISHGVGFLAVPLVALACWQLNPADPLGVAGWRWVVFAGGVAALAVWWIRFGLPESPRWLLGHGRTEEAERVVAALEARILADGTALPDPLPAAPAALEPASGSFAEIWRKPWRRRTLMMVVFNFFQTVAFYGFMNWVPTLIAAQGVTITKSGQYTFFIAIANPIGPFLFSTFADRFERKWQIVAAALGTSAFGLLFTQASGAAGLISCGVMITLSNMLLSYSFHTYQSELFPTHIRARAVGFAYSFSRLSVALSSFMIGFFLKNFGTLGVFGFITSSMVVVIVVIGIFGPRTRGLALEQI